MRDGKLKWAGCTLLPALCVIYAGCNNPSQTFTPTATGFVTFELHGGTLDNKNSCTPPTPPAPDEPTAPGASEVLAGYQDWRNTVTDSGGNQCQTSNAKRFEGMVTFDMSAVASNISAQSFSSITGTLTYTNAHTNAIPSNNNALTLCVTSLEEAASAPTATGKVQLNFNNGENFPASSPPSLGARILPQTAPYGSVTNTGPVQVDPATGKLTADISLMLSDWVKTKPGTLSVVMKPAGPTLAQLGIANGTPVPVNDASNQCTATLQNVVLTVNVNH